MSEEQLQRPQMKVNAAPLMQEDRYNFLPYIDRQADILPSQRDSWKTDEKAQAFMKAIENGEDITDTDWSGINLKGADLSGANLYGVNLSKANLTGTNLTGACLEWANLSYAYCEDTNFSNANMQNIQMKGVFYKNCTMDGADIDEKTMQYLQSVEWFLSQIENGKIKLDAIPQDQLNYLDLRTIDMSHVDIPENVDLSALVLEGVNLSGVYIPKGHLLNLAFMAKTKKRVRLIMQRTQKALELMYIRLKNERQQAITQYGQTQAKTPLVTRAYATKMHRPKKKISTSTEPLMDVKTTSESPKSTRPLHKLMSQAKKVKFPKINSKKRA